jgi:hypothetical protein
MDDITFKDIIGHTIINNGNYVSLDVNSKKFGSGSGNFNGNNSCLFVQNNYDFNVGDFTIDFQVKRNDINRLQTIFGQIDNLTTTSNLSIYIKLTASNIINVTIASGTNIYSLNSSTTFIDMNDFHHIAIVRQGAVICGYLDGQLFNSINIGNAIINKSNCNFTIGRLGDYVGTTYGGYFKGNIDEFRISNIARWTSNFTPPSEQYYSNSFLIKQNTSYYTIKPTNYDAITTHNFTQLTLTGGSIPNKADIETFGFDDLTVLGNSMTLGSDTFKPIDKLGSNFDIKMYKIN